jgi:TctA family transporter
MFNAILGFFIGLLTGFLPGFYITNILPINVNFEFIICSTVAFLFASVFPSVLLCAPNSENHLIAIPAFKFLKKGEALKSIDISLKSSLFSVFIFLFFIVFSFIFLESLYKVIHIGIFAILCLALLFLCKNLNSFFIVCISALFGIILLDQNMIAPMLSGFFGFSTLLISFNTQIPLQKIKNFKVNTFQIFRISAFSSFLSFIFAFVPAISSTILAFISKFFGKLNKVEFMSFTVSTNIYYILFSFLGILTIQKARSGPAFFLMKTQGELWILVLLVILTAIFSFLFLNKIKIFILRFFQKYRIKILSFSVCFILIFNFIFYGVLGLIVLIIATFIALLAFKLNVRRTTCMASMIVPTLMLII